LGGTTDLGIDVYMKEDNTNNPMAYFFNISLSPSFLFKYKFRINDTGFNFTQQIDTPLLSLISSSGYSSSLPYGLVEDDASFFDAMKLSSFGSLRKCVTVSTLDIKMVGSRPVIRLSYIFSGMNYKKDDFTITSADNIFLFGLIFHLFK